MRVRNRVACAVTRSNSTPDRFAAGLPGQSNPKAIAKSEKPNKYARCHEYGESRFDASKRRDEMFQSIACGGACNEAR